MTRVMLTRRTPHPNLLAARSLFPAALSLVILFAAPLPLTAGEPARPETEAAAPEGGAQVGKPEGVLARATYYASRYQGRRTSSGARYDAQKLTAAHPTLPLGTRLKVENTANRRSVEVTVNDRCAKRPFEVIDLSLAAARQLGFVRQGKAEVRLTLLEP